MGIGDRIRLGMVLPEDNELNCRTIAQFLSIFEIQMGDKNETTNDW
jgi:hypothetical protein